MDRQAAAIEPAASRFGFRALLLKKDGDKASRMDVQCRSSLTSTLTFNVIYMISALSMYTSYLTPVA